MCFSTLRNSPQGVPRTPNRLMHDAYVRKFDAFLKVIYFGKLFGLSMDVSENSGVFHPNHPLKNRVFHYFHHPILGYPCCWKHPYGGWIPTQLYEVFIAATKNQPGFHGIPSLKRSQRSYRWKWTVGIRFCFLWGAFMPIFRGELLVSGTLSLMASQATTPLRQVHPPPPGIAAYENH